MSMCHAELATGLQILRTSLRDCSRPLAGSQPHERLHWRTSSHELPEEVLARHYVLSKIPEAAPRGEQVGGMPARSCELLHARLSSRPGAEPVIIPKVVPCDAWAGQIACDSFMSITCSMTYVQIFRHPAHHIPDHTPRQGR